jgi:hypothetical protein
MAVNPKVMDAHRPGSHLRAKGYQAESFKFE